MNSKLLYTLCIISCLAGAGLYVYALIDASSLEEPENSIEKQIKNLNTVLNNSSTNIQIDKLRVMAEDVKAINKESLLVNKFFKKYRDNVEKYFQAPGMGKPGKWPKINRRRTPKGPQYLLEYKKNLVRLTNTYIKVLRPVAKDPGQNKKISQSFADGGTGCISYLAKWSQATPPGVDIFPSQMKFNIAEALCKATSKVKSGAKIQKWEVGTLNINASSASDFDDISVVFTCELPLKSQTALLREILLSKTVLFEVEQYHMKLPGPNAKKDWICLELTLRVLMIKEKLIAPRIKLVKIENDFPPKPAKAVREIGESRHKGNR